MRTTATATAPLTADATTECQPDAHVLQLERVEESTTEVHRMNATATNIMMPSITAEVLGPELMAFREELGEYCPACGQPDHELAEDDERIAEDIDAEQLRSLAAVYVMEWEDLDLVWRDRHWLPPKRR